MSHAGPNGRQRDALSETMDGDDAELEEHTPPIQHAPTEEELASRTDLITIEAQQHLDGWEEDDLQLFLELLEDAGSELQREMLNRAVAMGHSPTELHSFGDSIRGISDTQLFKLCTPPDDMPTRTAAQMEARLRAEADPLIAFRLNRAPAQAPAAPSLEPKTLPQSEVVQQAVQQTAKAGLKVQFSLSQSYDGSRPIGPPEPTGVLPAVNAPAPSASKNEAGAEAGVLRSRTQQVKLPAALMVETKPQPPPPAPPAPAPAPAQAAARPPSPSSPSAPAVARPPPPAQAAPPAPAPAAVRSPMAGPAPSTATPMPPAPTGRPPGPAAVPPAAAPRAPGPGPAAPPPSAGPAPAAAAPAAKKDDRKGFADDLFNDALKPFGFSVDEHVIDDEKITVEKVLPLATESLLRGVPVPVVLGSAKGDHRRYALILQVQISATGRSYQLHDPFAQETVWINDTDLLGLSQLGFTEKAHRRITAITLARALSGKLA